MNSKTKAILSLAIAAMLITTTYAVIRFSIPLPNNVRIKGYGLTLWRTDSGTEVTSVDWGDIDLGSSKTTDNVFSFYQKLTVKNTGDYQIYPAWQIDPATPLPAGVTLTGQHCNMEGEGWQYDWNENQVDSLFNVPPHGVELDRIRWTMTVSTEAQVGTFSFNIILLATDGSV